MKCPVLLFLGFLLFFFLLLLQCMKCPVLLFLGFFFFFFFLLLQCIKSPVLLFLRFLYFFFLFFVPTFFRLLRLIQLEPLNVETSFKLWRVGLIKDTFTHFSKL